MINWNNVLLNLLIMGQGIVCWEIGKALANYLCREKRK
jgi:hypothetical protein